LKKVRKKLSKKKLKAEHLPKGDMEVVIEGEEEE
jgi:hypothetical protein